MTTVLDHDEHLRTQIPALVPWALIAGGALFFVGGAMHPEEDPPDVTLKEHLRVMYEDGNWYASHTLQFIGVALVAVALVALARSGALASSRQAQRAGVVAAVGATFAFTDALDPLFPLASFIGVWAVVTGVSLQRRRTGLSAATGS